MTWGEFLNNAKSMFRGETLNIDTQNALILIQKELDDEESGLFESLEACEDWQGLERRFSRWFEQQGLHNVNCKQVYSYFKRVGEINN